MQATTVLFCGDVNVDLILDGLSGTLAADREVLARGFDVVLGSSAAIAASAHARLGGSTVFAGLGGLDSYGELVRSSLADAGVDTRLLRLDAGLRTGLTVNLVQEAGRYQVTFPGAIPRFVPDLEAILADGRIGHVHFAGIYLQDDLLPRLPGVLERLEAQGISTSVDPQWDSTGRWDGLRSWVPRTSTLFCNEEEACALAGEADPRAARDRLASVCPTVLVKQGRQGVSVRTPRGVWTCTGLVVEVKDAIGAGDNLAAAWLYATLTAGWAEPEALAFANAAAARSCTFSGGTGARSSADDVRFFQENYR